jgi:hypothetical protein
MDMEIPTHPVIDCDVHAVLPAIDALLPYLPAYWREQIAQTGFKGPVDSWYPPGMPTSARAEARPSDGSPPASRVGVIQRDVLGAPPHPSFAILSSDCAVESLHNPDAAAAIAGALNEWLVSEWLSVDARLRASIVVPSQFPELAVQEIERRALNPGFVQVLLPVRSETPYGSRNFRPVFAAAARHGLPVALHYGGAPGNPPTPVGWPSFYLEEYAGMTGVFQTQLVSIISGGVFDEHPDLRLVLAEGGFAWLPAMLWRFDKNWKGLRREIPWVRKPPSEYVREHVRLTTAPSDAPEDTAQFADVISQLGSDELLLYASDYPHGHGDLAAERGWAALPASTLRKVTSDNPRRLYRL